MNRFRFLLLEPVFGGKVAATAPQWLSSLIKMDMWRKKDSGACPPWTQVTFFFTFLLTVICKNTSDHLSSWEANFLPIKCCCSHNRCKQHVLIDWFFFSKKDFDRDDSYLTCFPSLQFILQQLEWPNLLPRNLSVHFYHISQFNLC